MIVVHKDLIISLSDLRYVRILCPQCQTIVVLDMKEKSAFAKEHGIFAPKKCPGCETPYDTAIQPSIDELQKSYLSLLKIADRISFSGESQEAIVS